VDWTYKRACAHTHTHTQPCNDLYFQDNQGKPIPEGWTIWDFAQAQGGSGISWTICKSFAPHSRQITTPAHHHSMFLRARCSFCHLTSGVEALMALGVISLGRVNLTGEMWSAAWMLTRTRCVCCCCWTSMHYAQNSTTSLSACTPSGNNIETFHSCQTSPFPCLWLCSTSQYVMPATRRKPMTWYLCSFRFICEIMTNL